MIAGIDFSTRAIDICLLTETSWSAMYEHIDLPQRKHPFLRAIDVAELMPTKGWWEDMSVHTVAIEEGFAMGKGVAKSMGVIAGAIIARLPRDVTVVTITPKDWKRAFCGDPDAPKAKVAETYWSHWPGLRADHPVREHTTQDQMDAYGIAWAVAQMIEMEEAA